MRILYSAAIILLSVVPAFAAPKRIVSTNVCADQLTLALAKRERIVSLSRLAREAEISNLAQEAAGIALNNARAEEIIQLRPDLVMGDIYTGKHANSLAKTIGVPVHIVSVASSIDDVRAIIRAAARALGEPAKAERMIVEMNLRIERAKNTNSRPVTALVYEPNGLTSGNGTMPHEVMTISGLTNLAAHLMKGAYGSLPLEIVVAQSPELLIIDDSYTSTSSRAQNILRHPAFKSVKSRTALYAIPSRLWLCPGPWIAEAVERLTAERLRLTNVPEEGK